jgi:hypothetical protein
MKRVLVIGDLNEKLTSVLDKCKEEKLIEGYVNYQIYNKAHKSVNDGLHLNNASLSNTDFCDMFLESTNGLELERNWIILKGDIHTDTFLRILIKFEKYNADETFFLSHILHLTSPDKKISCYLSDGAMNTKQITDHNVYNKIINNAQEYIVSHKEGVSKIDPVINTSIILAANNPKIPGYDIAKEYCWASVDHKHMEIQQFDECFSAEAWLLKNKDADPMMFTYPDLLITLDITVGNVIWKSLTILNKWSAEGYVIGGRLSTVLLSRSDSAENYYNSIKGVCK